MKNLQNLMRKQGGKPIICYFVVDKKPLKPSKETGKKTWYWWRIETRFLKALKETEAQKYPVTCGICLDKEYKLLITTIMIIFYLFYGLFC